MRTILQQFVIAMALAMIVMGISILTITIPQAAYAQQYQGNQSSSSGTNCASDQLPASINGTIQCMRQGECYSEVFDGKEVKHCNFMMSNQ
jgi:hypothetical protein